MSAERRLSIFKRRSLKKIPCPLGARGFLKSKNYASAAGASAAGASAAGFDLGESLRTELGLLGLFSTRSSGLAFDGATGADFVEQVHDADLLEEATDGVGRLCASLEPLEHLFLVELDVRGLLVRVVETDLFDKAIVAGLAGVDDHGAVDGVVTLAETSETDNGCHFNLFL